jgi:hypothetical protein
MNSYSKTFLHTLVNIQIIQSGGIAGLTFENFNAKLKTNEQRDRVTRTLSALHFWDVSNAYELKTTVPCCDQIIITIIVTYQSGSMDTRYSVASDLKQNTNYEQLRHLVMKYQNGE